MPLRQMVCSPRKLHTVTSNLLSCNEGVPSLGALHDAWRIRVFDATRARAYAVDFGNFPGRWFSGPSSSLTVTRSDVHAGRPNAFRHHPKKLVDIKPLTTEFHQDVSIYGVDDSVLLKLCDSEILMTAQAEGAAIELHGQGEQECQLTGMTTLQYELSSLRSQTLRLPVFYTFDHPAGYHEDGNAVAHVQRVWGDTIVPQWVTCLGYAFKPGGHIETILDVTLGGEPFAIGYHSTQLQWYFSDLNGAILDTQVEAEYGKLKITAQKASQLLVITAGAPHRTFDIWSLPTSQGFQGKGIQTFSGTATVEAFEDDRLIDTQLVQGVNLQFGACHAERTVQRMTAQQYSSPLRYKGKGVTR